MSNDHIKSEISAYLAGGLTESRNRQIEAHAAACEKCRQALSKARSKQSRLKREALKKMSGDRSPNLFLARQGKDLVPDSTSMRWPLLIGGLFIVGGAAYWGLRNPVADVHANKGAASSAESTDAAVSAASAPVVSPVPTQEVAVSSPAATPVAVQAPPPAKAATSIRSEKEWQGADSGIKDQRLLVVRSQSKWNAMWSEMAAGAAPDVNFDDHVVVAVFAGERPSGATIDLGKIRDREDDVLISFRITSPEVTASTASVPSPSHPYLLSLIPRVEKRIRLTEKEVSQ